MTRPGPAVLAAPTTPGLSSGDPPAVARPPEAPTAAAHAAAAQPTGAPPLGAPPPAAQPATAQTLGGPSSTQSFGKTEAADTRKGTAADAPVPIPPPLVVAGGPLPLPIVDTSLARGITQSEPLGLDALPTLPLPTAAVAPGSSPKLVVPEARPTIPAGSDEAPPTEDSLTAPPGPKISSDRMSSSQPKLALGPVQVLPGRIARAARAIASAASEQYRSILALRTTPAEKRPRWLLYVVAVAGLGVGVGLVVLAMSLAGRHGSEASETGRTAGSPSLSASAAHGSKAPGSEGVPSAAAPTAPAAPEGSAAPAPEATAATAGGSLAPCAVAGAAKTLAPTAVVAAGVDVRALGDDVAVGFALTDHQAEVMRVDPSTLAASSPAAARSKTTIGHVTPSLSGKGALRALVDSDRKTDVLRARRTIPTTSPIQLGESGGNLVWTHAGGGPAATLWPLDPASEIDAVRATSEGTDDDSMTAIAFRSAGSIEVGLATGRDALVAKGDLAKFSGLGPAVGAPAIALNDGVVLVAWADRPSADVPWRLRWVRFKAGDAPDKPSMFTPPGGGNGEQAMSPSIAAVPGKRFLLLWTEGPTSQHDVRGITLSEDGTPLGAPLVLSSPGVNAGQGQAAITSAGRGVVAFLESSEDHFKVVVSPIVCGM